ncbi:MAG: 5-methyltetrahydropteroyltriglutamate--homocysteine S-methyltransferase, partial [Campylobacterales bacterium]
VPKEQITVSSSCSLLHVPYSLEAETKLDPQIKQWLAFTKEKLGELNLVTKRFFGETLDDFETRQLEQSRAAVNLRKHSTRIHDPEVRARVNAQSGSERALPYEERLKLQHEALDYPLLPTTTIGSFPQTPELRALRRDYKRGDLDTPLYEAGIKAYIDDCIAFQESIGLDVLVHGEPERNDMVEYFGEQLDGFAFSANGWVQSYGSRCVKPPLIYGDVSRPQPMTVGWTTYAQSKTDKIVKGMLTGPVTILNWSFVRNDLPRADVAEQIALAIGDEVDDLQNAGIRIIQVDEAAFKEGYPLRRENIGAYETWAVDAFRRSVACAQVGYKQEVGPGVYDIHSPRVPPVAEMAAQINALLEVLPKEQLWINPDCGLKTRKWEEVKPSLANMVDAVKEVRASFDAIIASKKGDAPWTNDSRSSTATSGSLR